MAIPNTREELIDWCLRKLGEPVIRVNVDKSQLDDRVDEALSLFYERHYGGTEKEYIIYDISDADTAQGYILLPNDIIAVTDVFRPQIFTSGVTALDYQYRLVELYQLASSYSYGDLSYYYLSRMHFGLISYMLVPERQFTFNSLSKKLILAGGLKQADMVDGGVYIEVLRKLHGEVSDTDPSDTSIHNIWADRWLKEYTCALIKQSWGNNLKKFGGVTMLGGVSLNGDKIFEEATEELKDLEDKLNTEYSLPPMGFYA